MFVYVFLKIVWFYETMWENVEADRPRMIKWYSTWALHAV